MILLTIFYYNAFISSVLSDWCRLYLINLCDGCWQTNVAVGHHAHVSLLLVYNNLKIGFGLKIEVLKVCFVT